MDKLKELFGEGSLTYAELEAKLKDNKDVKLANLATGQYVDKKKYEDKVAELTTAQNTITGLQDTVKKFDRVDVEGLKQNVTDLENKYNTDMAAVKLDSAVSLALVEAKAKNPKLAKAALDMSLIKLDGDKLYQPLQRVLLTDLSLRSLHLGRNSLHLNRVRGRQKHSRKQPTRGYLTELTHRAT